MRCRAQAALDVRACTTTEGVLVAHSKLPVAVQGRRTMVPTKIIQSQADYGMLIFLEKDVSKLSHSDVLMLFGTQINPIQDTDHCTGAKGYRSTRT